MPRARSVCNVPSCPTLTAGSGRCAEHEQAASRARGSSTQRGYGPRWRAARAKTLARDPVCVLCRSAPSNTADHWPRSRHELEAAGVGNPDAPEFMRGLCRPCHSRETAKHQPGGWNARD